MIPILFEEGTTTFNTNGICRLADAISCPVEENRNGSFELQLKYPVRGRYAHEIIEGRIIYAIHDDAKEPQPFDIYKVVASSKDTITAYARHVAYRLQKYTVLPFTTIGITGQDLLDTMAQNIVGSCPFTFYSDIPSALSAVVTTPLYPVNVWSLFGDSTEDQILSNYDGEWKFDGFTVSLLASRGQNRGVKIRRGKNASNIKVTKDISEQLTGVVPYWTGTDLDTGYPQTIYDTNDPIVYASDHTQFAVEKIEPLDMTDMFETKPTVTQVKNAAIAWLDRYVYNNRNCINYSIDLVSMTDVPDALKMVRLCDTVQVEDEVLGLIAQVKVIKTVYDAVTEKLTRIEVGSPKRTLSYTLKYAGAGDVTNDLASTSANGATSTNTNKQAKTNAVKIKALEQKVASGGGGGSGGGVWDPTNNRVMKVGGPSNSYSLIRTYNNNDELIMNQYNGGETVYKMYGTPATRKKLLDINDNGLKAYVNGNTEQVVIDQNGVKLGSGAIHEIDDVVKNYQNQDETQPVIVAKRDASDFRKIWSYVTNPETHMMMKLGHKCLDANDAEVPIVSNIDGYPLGRNVPVEAHAYVDIDPYYDTTTRSGANAHGRLFRVKHGDTAVVDMTSQITPSTGMIQQQTVYNLFKKHDDRSTTGGFVNVTQDMTLIDNNGTTERHYLTTMDIANGAVVVKSDHRGNTNYDYVDSIMMKDQTTGTIHYVKLDNGVLTVI